MASMLEVPGSFAQMCRCGKEACVKHETADTSGEKRVLLPSHSRPVKYVLDLKLRLEEHAFEGYLEIEVKISQPTATLILHSKELTFESAYIDENEVKIRLEPETSTVIFESVEKVLLPGVCQLKVKYKGVLNDSMCGFYRSTYTNFEGDKKLMASTQFESIDARRCFPCWDEPAIKSVFKCSLTVPKHMTALSNMPEEKIRTLNDEMKLVEFMESPKMSTYLLAFVVGEFDAVSRLTKRGVLIRCFTPQGKPELGEFGLDCAVKALDEYDSTFQLPYPLPKLDMVAIPEFAAGAMENWGLVTYREVDLLVDPISASSRQRQRVAEVVIHELAHQWFGNLCTMTWWSELWLNEGFATWMETSVCAELYPSWQLWVQFITDMQGRALNLDALKNSHPIHVPISQAEEVEQVFDAISYCKGGAVIRMAFALLGKDDFVSGLRNYMKEFQYGNVTTQDLWSAWESASKTKVPVSSIMNQWTTQTGFPLIEVHDDFTLTQRRFLSDGAVDDSATKWTIPIFAVSDKEPFLMGLMPPDETPWSPSKGWLKLNAGQHVPCRVKYPSSMLPKLVAAVRAQTLLSPEDRIGLLSDYAALSRAGLIPLEELLEILSAFNSEKNDAVVSTVISEFVSLSKTLVRGGLTDLNTAVKKMAQKILEPHVLRLKWDPSPTDAHLSKKLRGELIASFPSLYTDDLAVLEEAKKRFSSFANGEKEALPSEYQAAVYKLVLNSNVQFLDPLLKLYSNLELNEEKKSVLAGFGAAPDSDSRNRVLDLALSDQVKLQDFFYVALAMHASSVDGRDATWQHFQSNLDAYKNKVGDAGSSLLDASITAACSGFASLEKADEIQAFFQANPLPRNQRKIDQTIEAVRTTAKYVDAITNSSALLWLQQAGFL